jgi:hypothetical protein
MVYSKLISSGLGLHGYKAIGREAEPNPFDKLHKQNVVSPHFSFVYKVGIRKVIRWKSGHRNVEKAKAIL